MLSTLRLLSRHRSSLLRLLLGSSIAGLSASSVLAATINVPTDYPTIQQALDAAASGDTVLVAAGTYNEHDLEFGEKDIELRSASGPATTIIEASSLGRVFVLGGPLTRAALIEGFTIRGGLNTDGSGGAGILIVGGSPTIRGNWIRSNITTQTGGGIKAVTAGELAVNPLIVDNLISDNEGHEGGAGLHISSATAEIVGNTIVDNDSTQTLARTGAGVKVTFSTATVEIRNNEIRRNRVSGAGGGIASFVGDIMVVDNEITDNEAGELGGGVLFEVNNGDPDKTGTLINNVISRNVAGEDPQPGVSPSGGAVHTYLENTPSSSFVMIDNVIEDNTCLNPSCLTVTDPCCKGGAIAAFCGVAKQEFSGNTLRGNRADQYGAVLLIDCGSSTIAMEFEENLVEGNTSRHGFPSLGCVGTESCLVARNRFLENKNDLATVTASRNPGALYLKDAGITTIQNNYFRANEGYHNGAILIVDQNLAEPPAVIRNNTFVDNVTHWSSGGTVGVEEPAMIDNNVFAGDIRGIRTWLNPSIDVRENDFFDFTTGVLLGSAGLPNHTTAASLNGELYASGNEEVDPAFLFADDVFLGPGSLLVDAGRCDLAPGDDITGQARPIGAACEIGADEFDPAGLLIFEDGFESGDTSGWTSQVP